MSEKENSFLSGPILPALLKFALPVLLAMFLQALYGAADLWAVGRFCTAADVAAVSAGSQTMMIATGLITGLSMGSTVALGQSTGEKDSKSAADAVGASIWIFGVLSVLISALLIFAAPSIAKLMNAPGESFEKTAGYIRICGAGTVFIVAYNVISSIFRGLGNSREPLFFVFVACIVNISADIILIRFFHMAAEGAAAATVAAQALSVLISLLVIKKQGLPFPLGKDNLRFKKAAASRILRIGSPIALHDSCNEISFLIIIGLVNTLGVTKAAGVGVAEKIILFILLIPSAFVSSVSAFVAHNAGAGQFSRARKAMWSGMLCSVLMGSIMAYLLFFHGDAFSLLFVNDELVAGYSAEYLKATAIECFIHSVCCCLTGYFNGLGKTAFVMAQGLAASFLVRIPLAAAASRMPEPRLFTIGLSAVAAALFSLLASLIYYPVSRRKR